MIKLPHDCKCSELGVFPKKWNTLKSTIKVLWYIHYRFYDASGKKKQVALRGMNQFSDYEDRKAYTLTLLDRTKAKLLGGYNPFTQEDTPEVELNYAIEPTTPFLKAIAKAAELAKCSQHTKDALRYIVKFTGQAARTFKFDTLPISAIVRRHIKQILQEMQATRKLTPGSYNHYRAYLMMIFKELVELDAIENNPVTGIKKQLQIKKIRETLTPDERKAVDAFLQEKHKSFWRYLHIFFHSGSRSAELLRLQGKDVDLKAQYFKRTVIKGTQRREVKTMIKDSIIHLWKEAMEGCGPDQYVFAKYMKPGDVPIHPDQITKRWFKYVKRPKSKGGLGIKADFYSLKHLHSDQVAAELGMHAAGSHNAHTSIGTTRIYTVNEAEREAARLKKLGNTF